MDYTVHGILQARILEWVAFPFSRESSQPRDQTQVTCTAERFFTSGATRELLPKGLFKALDYQFVFVVAVQSLCSVWTLCNPMDCGTLASSVLHYLRSFSKFMSVEFVTLLSHLIFWCPFFAFNLSQH